MSTDLFIVLPVGIFVALILLVIMYSWKERDKRIDLQTQSNANTPMIPLVQNNTVIYTIPTIRQLEVMFPALTEASEIRRDELPPAYVDVSLPPSYDQIDVRLLEKQKEAPSVLSISVRDVHTMTAEHAVREVLS